MSAARVRILLTGAAAVLIGLVTGCGSSAAPPAAASGGSFAGQLAETGSTLLLPLMQNWAAGYHRQFPGVTVTTAGTGSGTGIKDASDGQAAIGTSDAYLSSGNLVENPALVNIPLVVSAQPVDYNLPELSAAVHVKLDGAVLAGMYQGTITTWNALAIRALNPGVPLPAIAVVPIHRSDVSGDTFLFSSYLSTQDSTWNNAIGYGTTVAWPSLAGRSIAAKGNSGMVGGCATTPGCVAYLGISYRTKAMHDRLGEAQLANAAGQYELPTAAAIDAAVARFVSLTPPNETISLVDGPAPDGYPIVNYEYAIVDTRQADPVRARGIAAFLRWVITTGNSAGYVDQLRFRPLPPAVVTLAQAQIAGIR